MSLDRKPFISRSPLQQPNHIIARTALLPTVQSKTKMIIISLYAYHQVIQINKLDKQNYGIDLSPIITIQINKLDKQNSLNIGCSWLRSPAVEHRSLAGVLSLSCARLAADG